MMTELEVLALSADKIRRLEPRDFWARDITPAEVTRILEACGAVWLHNGVAYMPHVELTSGMCSNGFVNVLAALSYPDLAAIFADQLVRKFRTSYHERDRVSWVVGSDHASATISYAVARCLGGARHDFTEKSGSTGKEQVWKRFIIQPGEVVLQVEELVTTTGTLEAVRKGIREGTPHPVTFAPVILALIHRSSTYEFEGAPIIHLAHYDISTWKPEDCPLCKAGSRRLRPKQHWAELTAQ